MAHSIKLFQYFLFSILLFGSVSAQTITADTDPHSATFGTFYVVDLEPAVMARLQQYRDSIAFDSFFYVTVDNTNKIIGSYIHKQDSLVFKPRFLPDINLKHQAYVNLNVLYKNTGLPLTEIKKPLLRRTISFKAPNNDHPNIKVISPEMDLYPANILRLYVYFDQPMSLQNPYDYISLVNQQGKTISEPFVIIPEGLWDASKTRLTLFFHPGRIKRNVGPNNVIGPVFEVGNTYTLKIDSTWLGANGLSLQSPVVRTFEIGEAVRSPIQPEKWHISVPETQYSPLIISTNEKLDPVLFPKMIKVLNQQQVQVEGAWKLKADEWHFIPTSHWLKGKHSIKIDPTLEDICGNTVLSAFDRASTKETKVKPILEMPFEFK